MLPFDEEVKKELRKLFSNTVYKKAGIIEGRIEQLFQIHSRWLEMAKRTYSSNVIAQKLFQYDENLAKINGKSLVV